jgi:hypothetical protein
MKIILEGWDAVGKSTLARELGRRLDWPVQWLGPAPVARPFRWYATGMDRHRAEVLDRSWWSVAAYGPLVRTRVELKPEELFYLELLTWDSLLVHCRCEPEVVARRLGAAPNEYEAALEPGKGQDYFEDLIERESRLPLEQSFEMDLTPEGDEPPLERGSVRVSTGRSNLDINVGHLEGLVRGATPGPQLRGVGCTRGPQIAIVGDVEDYGEPLWHRGGVATYLLRALLTVEPRLTTDGVYLTGATWGEPLARELWQVQPRIVLVSGARAHYEVTTSGLEGRDLGCLGEWVRDKPKQEEELGRRIAELAKL